VKVPQLQWKRKSGMIVLAAAVLVGLGGWAFAEGGVPLIGSPTADTTGPTTTAVPQTQGAATDNVAVASNTKDGRTVVAISLKIVQTDAATVDPTNAAVAVASCSDCQTVAIALEGVLVAGNPDTFDPTNVALAINADCSNCQTLATAYQDVVQNDTRVRITGAGRQEIASIRKDLESLRNSGLDIVAMQQRVNDDAGRFLAVLRNDVVPVGKPAASTTTTSTTSTTVASGQNTTSTTAATTSTTSAATDPPSTGGASGSSTTTTAP
jgi:putative peptide zinc metalloprotease protein